MYVRSNFRPMTLRAFQHPMLRKFVFGVALPGADVGWLARIIFHRAYSYNLRN